MEGRRGAHDGKTPARGAFLGARHRLKISSGTSELFLECQKWTGGAPVHRGPGCAALLPEAAAAAAGGKPVVLITGDGCMARRGAAAKVAEAVLDSAAPVLHFTLPGEPEDSWIDEARDGLKTMRPAAVVSIGGGSVLDAGKALAALVHDRGPAKDFLEGVGTMAPSGKMLPWFAAPTTAGTGSEATTNAVISHHGIHSFKKSLRHPAYRPAAVFLDPELVAGLAPPTAAACALDAFTQLLESYTSRTVGPGLEKLLERGIDLAAAHLPRFVQTCPDPDPEAAQAMLDAAFLSGIGLTHAGLGTIHGLAGTAGALSRIPHAAFCAKLFAPAWGATVSWLAENREEPGAAKALEKLGGIARRAGWCPAGWADGDAAAKFAEVAGGWCGSFGLRPLREYGIGRYEIDEIVAAGSDRNSPARLGAAAWERLLREAGAA